MRIGMLTWESLHSIAVGGVAAHVSELARALANEGHDVHVFTRRGPGQPADQVVDGATYHRCSFWLSPDFVWETDDMCRSFIDRVLAVESEAGEFDILHGHDWLTAMSLAWTKNGDARRYIFTFHSTEYGRCGNQHWEGRSRAIRDREWWGAYTAHRVIAVSGRLKDEIQQIYRVPADKIQVVYNGVDVHRFDLPVDVGSVKERYGLGRMDPTVLFCGRMVWQKGPDILLEAIPPLLGHHPRAKCLFVGDGEMRWGLEQRARALGIRDAARFLGHRSGRELAELFKIADVVCVPSRNEPFGIVILEAWSAEKPVVATHNGGPGEFVRHGTDGLLVHDSPDSVGWGLGTMFLDFEKARWMGRNGRAAAEERFDWRTIGRQVANVYESTGAASAPSPGSGSHTHRKEPDDPRTHEHSRGQSRADTQAPPAPAGERVPRLLRVGPPQPYPLCPAP